MIVQRTIFRKLKSDLNFLHTYDFNQIIKQLLIYKQKINIKIIVLKPNMKYSYKNIQVDQYLCRY